MLATHYDSDSINISIVVHSFQLGEFFRGRDKLFSFFSCRSVIYETFFALETFDWDCSADVSTRLGHLARYLSRICENFFRYIETRSK